MSQNDLVYLLVAILKAFCIGAIPIGEIIAILKGTTLLTKGSGSIGATNASRVLGTTWGIIVFTLDILKGVCVVAVVQLDPYPLSAPTLVLLASIFAMVGHSFSPFLKWRGGKGVATGLGIILSNDPLLACIVLGAFILMFLSWRLARGVWVISVASLTAAATLIAGAFILELPAGTITLYSLIGIFVWCTHTKNIKRLINGTELGLTFGKTK